MSSSSRKKEKISPETLAPLVEEEDNICSEDDMSCPNSCVSEDDENTSC
jgi:hypothetical protein